MARNVLGDTIELTDHVLDVNLAQIDHWLNAAARFESEGDLASAVHYLECALRQERAVEHELSVTSP